MSPAAGCAEFREAMLAAGLSPPDHIEPGKFHRFPGTGKRNGNRAGWCKLFPDGQGGTFGDYSTDLSESWQAKTENPRTKEEQEAFRRAVATARKQAEQARHAAQTEATKKASATWQGAAPAPADHPYLVLKGAKSHGIKQAEDGRLLVPLLDVSGKLWSLQYIDAAGGKRFFPDGRTKGCYYPLGGKPENVGPVCIAEGFATAATIHEATGYPVAVAFNAGNLKAVAEAIRAKLPESRLILCADDDHATEGNPGLTRAREAAQAVGGLVAVPEFGHERPEKATDFNDLAALRDLETVRACIDAVQAAKTPCVPASETAEAEATIERLASLSLLQYDQERKTAADALNIRPATLDKLVADVRHETTTDEDHAFDEVEPWPHPVDGAQLLSDLSETVRRFIVCQPETAHAVALWAAMTWFIDVVQVAPLAIITAPEKRCGKSQLLFLMARVVARPMTASNISPSALFRAIDTWRPTLLVDEADAFMRENEELRGLLNCGHTRESAYVVRTVGDSHEVRRFNAWGAKALAGIGRLADTLMDRAVVLELRRKLPHENVERLRHAEPDLFETLAAKLCRFAEDNREAVRKARPDLPCVLNDRAQDNWEPLLAIAGVAGGPWPALARAAALKLSGASDGILTIGLELLSDIRQVFEDKAVDRLGSADLITALCVDEERPWATYNRGFPIKPRQVARLLAEYGIKSKNIRIGNTTPKGYELEQFTEAFARYLASPPSTSATAPQPAADAVSRVADGFLLNTENTLSATLKPAPVGACGAVADIFSGGTDQNMVTETI